MATQTATAASYPRPTKVVWWHFWWRVYWRTDAVWAGLAVFLPLLVWACVLPLGRQTFTNGRAYALMAQLPTFLPAGEARERFWALIAWAIVILIVRGHLCGGGARRLGWALAALWFAFTASMFIAASPFGIGGWTHLVLVPLAVRRYVRVDV